MGLVSFSTQHSHIQTVEVRQTRYLKVVFIPKACVITNFRLALWDQTSTFTQTIFICRKVQLPTVINPNISASAVSVKCVQFHAATTVAAAVLESASHKSAARFVYKVKLKLNRSHFY